MKADISGWGVLYTIKVLGGKTSIVFVILFNHKYFANNWPVLIVSHGINLLLLSFPFPEKLPRKSKIFKHVYKMALKSVVCNEFIFLMGWK